MEHLSLVYQNLESFDSNTTNAISNEIKIVKNLNPNLPRNKSFKTSFSSTLELSNKPRLYKTEKAVGIAMTGTLDEVFKKVFSKLKEMNIVWKNWGSDFVYKCQSGIPFTQNSFTDDLKDKKDIYDNDMIKFFLQFSSFPRKKELIDLDQSVAHQHQILVSFIWIKGPTMKYLDFFSNFHLSL